MGKPLADALPLARHVFQEVDDALGQNLTRLMFEGPEEELKLTENTQPALLAVSVAVVRALEDSGLVLTEVAYFVAGHSLGEYSALTIAGSLTLADAARLLKLRGQAMQRAVPSGQGAMAALLGIEVDGAREVCTEAAKGQVCGVANDNGGGQVVISGDKDAVDRAIALAPEKGAKRAIALPVSAPFHCALMAPAAEEMKDVLADANIVAPSVPLVANVTAEPVMDPDTIRSLLVDQVTAMVRWRESILYLRDQGVDTLVELGSGKVLTGLARRIDREMTGQAIESPDDIETFFKEL
jgi:[acyl-carrier-protein] S-malonyltransferase